MNKGLFGHAIAFLCGPRTWFLATRIGARKVAADPAPRLDRAAAPRIPAAAGEPVELQQLLGLMSRTHGPMLQRHDIGLELVLTDQPIFVLAVPDDLQLLLGHIFGMAASLLHGGTALHVLARADGHHAVINWRDAGDEGPQLARAFEGFGRPIASRALTCQTIAARYGARVYPAPSPLGDRSLTLRIPLLRQRKTPGAGVCP